MSHHELNVDLRKKSINRYIPVFPALFSLTAFENHHNQALLILDSPGSENPLSLFLMKELGTFVKIPTTFCSSVTYRVLKNIS